MIENSSALNHVASGGKVWQVPALEEPASQNVVAPSRKEASLWVPAITVVVLMAVIGVCIWIITSYVDGGAPKTSDEAKWAPAYEQEYGYSSAQYGDDHFEADVVTVSGEKKTVGYMEYDGYQVFYEDQDQLAEKIDKIEAGTYPQALRDE